MVAFSDIIDFLLTLLTDDAARAEFDENPQQALQDAGLEGVTAADIRDARLQLADSGAVTATDDGRGSSYPDGDDPVREIGYTTQHYVADETVVHDDAGHGDLSLVNQGDTFVTIDDRDTLFFQSISDDDVTINQDNSVNNQLAIQDNDVNVSDDDTTINAEDSFNSDDDLVAIQDNDVNGGDEVIDIDVTGGVGSGPDEPEELRTPTSPPSRGRASSTLSRSRASSTPRHPRRTSRPSPGSRRPTSSRSTRSRWTRRRTRPTPTTWPPTTSPPTTHCRCEAVVTSDPVAVVERRAPRSPATTVPTSTRAWPPPTPDCSTSASGCWWSASSSRARACWSTAWSAHPSARRSTMSPRPCRPSCGTPTHWTSRWSGPTASASGSRATELADRVCEQGNPGNREGWSHAEIGLPRPLLKGGLEIVDTPGVGGLSSVHGAATMAALPSADAVLLVSDAAQEYTAPELEFLAHAASVCPNVACVITKTDLHPEWRRIVDLDRGHLAAAGINAEIFAVSSTLRWHAVLHGDAELNAESGFPELVGYLRKRVLGQADRLARRGVVHDVLAVTEQIGGNLRRRAHGAAGPGGGRRADPRADRGPGPRDRAEGAVRALAADPQRRHRRPQRRHRLRPARPDAGDQPAGRGRAARRRRPAKVWDQFAGWVEQEVAAAAAANFIWATQRVRALAKLVAEHFSDDRDQLLPSLRSHPSDAIRSVRAMTAPAAEAQGVGTKALTGLRGGYMGMLMFGMLGTLVGFSSDQPGGHRGGRGDGREGHRRRAQEAGHPAAGRGQGRHAPLHRRRDVPGRQGLPRPPARGAARPARPLHRAGRPAQALAAGVAAGRRAGGEGVARRAGGPAGRDRQGAGAAGPGPPAGAGAAAPAGGDPAAAKATAAAR